VQEHAEAAIALCKEHGFPYWLAEGTILRGWALAEQGQGTEGIAQLREGLAVYQATGAELGQSYWLDLLAEAYGKVGQVKEGLTALAEALALGNQSGERFYEAELYRLKGELTLQQFQVPGSKFKVPSTRTRNQKREARNHSPTLDPQAEAEACFRKAIEIAQCQRAKSLELRATMSLARLWRRQGKKDEARRMLADIYGWFTEGFDTKDLQEAKTLLAELR
jgi:predicted ATPase